jgi:hypothetical protein
MAEDKTETKDLAAEIPEKVKQLTGLWFARYPEERKK